MNKRQLIEDIRQYNQTAAPQFLAQFDEDALKQYLTHLESARQKHVTLSRVVRRASSARTTVAATAAA